MDKIQYSGNVDDPESFSLQDMENMISTYNATVDAINFLLNYINRSNQSTVQKSLEQCGIEKLEHINQYPHNAIISALGMACSLHREAGRGSYDTFTSLATLKLMNAASEYEMFYSQHVQKLVKMYWSFQLDVLFAFDKLCTEIKKFKAKYKDVIGLHKTIAELDKYTDSTARVIGTPEIEWFNGGLTVQQAIVVREKLSAANTPLYPFNIYRDVMRLESAKETAKRMKRERSRTSHYDNAQYEIDSLTDKNIELAQTNIDLAQRVQQLEQENEKLLSGTAQTETDDLASANIILTKTNADMAKRIRQLEQEKDKLLSKNAKLTSENAKLSQQIATNQRGKLGKLLHSVMQKKK